MPSPPQNVASPFRHMQSTQSWSPHVSPKFTYMLANNAVACRIEKICTGQTVQSVVHGTDNFDWLTPLFQPLFQRRTNSRDGTAFLPLRTQRLPPPPPVFQDKKRHYSMYGTTNNKIYDGAAEEVWKTEKIYIYVNLKTHNKR